MGLTNPLHLLIILGVVLLVFGPKRLPELGRSLGRGFRELSDGLSGKGEDHAPASSELPEPQPVTAAKANEQSTPTA